MKKIIFFILTIFISAQEISYKTNDICHNELEESGGCFNIVFFSFNFLCTKTYPIQVNSSLQNVEIYYNDSGLNFGINSCGVDPSGTCEEVSTINFGPFGFFNTMYKFDLGDVSSDNNYDIWASSSGFGFFDSSSLYVKYEKDGILHEGVLRDCGSNVFDIWDEFRSINDKEISTKIVNKPFSLKIASLNLQENEKIPFSGTVCARVIGDNFKSEWNETHWDGENEKDITFNIKKAIKDAYVEIRWINGYFHCPLDEYNISFSSDNFAIRPEKFVIDVNESKIRAGRIFHVDINATQYGGGNAKDYNETNNTSFVFNVNDIKSNCITGSLGNLPNPFQFKDGNISFNTNYSEVGEVNFSIHEIKGEEFAKVDSKDKNVSGYWNSDINLSITPASVVVKFIPDHFNISASYNNYKNSNFTYISNDLNMSSVLDINITAVNEQNNSTKNYNLACYAKDFDLNISYNNFDVPSKIKKILFKEKNSNEITYSIPQIITNSFSNEYFSTDTNSTAELIFYINFEKNYTSPVNEFNFTIKEINISDGDTFGNKNLEKNATFYYGRIDIQNVSGYGNEINNTFKYEFWKDNEGWVVNPYHNAYFGDVNKSSSYLEFLQKFFGINININSIINGKEKVIISTSHSLPYSTKIPISIPSWLWYHPLAKNYQNPDINFSCLTHPCFDVDFLIQGKGWGGVYNNDENYSVNKRVVDINISTSKIKVNKSEVRKLNW